MPDMDFVDTFKKPSLDITKPMPYNLRVDYRGQEKGRRLGEKVGVVLSRIPLFCFYLVEN